MLALALALQGLDQQYRLNAPAPPPVKPPRPSDPMGGLAWDHKYGVAATKRTHY